jgi:predicted RNase H-like HicB family nuclease
LIAARICVILFSSERELYDSRKAGLPVAMVTLTAVLHKEEDLYVAECPEVGTVSQGHTVEEAIANLKEATELYLEEFPLYSTGKPLLTTFEAAVSEAVYAQAAQSIWARSVPCPGKARFRTGAAARQSLWCSGTRRPRVP